MENTYNSLKIVFQNLKKEHSKNPSFLFIILVLCCIPLPYAYNSVALVLLTLVTFFTFKKQNFKTRHQPVFSDRFVFTDGPFFTVVE